MKPTAHISFDDLPDVAMIQIRPLVNLKILPYSATTIWRLCRNGKFPRPTKISPGITAWRVGDIRNYLHTICQKSNGGGAS
jgi:predicted DNA-binding transcriptional regulator AlpA